MRENRPYGSEGGVGASRSLPLSKLYLIPSRRREGVARMPLRGLAPTDPMAASHVDTRGVSAASLLGR
jgi:hypothetical protein